ncbi:MAG: lytic transglycosylase domain-containing protein [Bacteroidetes bacterium]|nr:lytic transglycosylase domain-containing protein [Bacteroidota bacterium]MBS1740778.1 lytic transglycosylase domain-containing protein [Bacteroidota bacterium]
MQYKGFVFVALSALSINSYAQKYQDFTLAAKNTRLIKSDTIVKKATPLVAANALPMPALIGGKKPVPLAGQKSYFGAMNDYVVEYTNKYMDAHNKTLSVVKERGKVNFSLIDNVLAKNDIPKELKYLAVIESALNNQAISPVGAVGPWQFMESTARLMGLTVNNKRDDRKDFYKSTHAAAKYLSVLYDQLNDWLLVVAAYNSGPTPVLRAMEKTGSNNFWDIKQYLPRETQGHVLAFIATASIFENMSKFIGMSKSGKHNGSDVATSAKEAAPAKPSFSDEELKNMAIVRISDPLSMDLMAQDLKIERKLLDKWNPDYDLFETANYNDEFYSLRIPKDKLDNFIEHKEFLTKKSKQIFSGTAM